MTNGISFVQTGGTIDSFYDGARDMVVPREQTIIEKYINSTKLSLERDFATVCLKDSRTLTDEDRASLVAAIEASAFDKVIVTHGLFTIGETTRFLLSHLRAPNKTVLITGSMMPIDGFAMSDAGFNLGFAVAESQRLEPGIFVCIRGATASGEDVASQPETTLSSFFSN